MGNNKTPPVLNLCGVFLGFLVVVFLRVKLPGSPQEWGEEFISSKLIHSSVF